MHAYAYMDTHTYLCHLIEISNNCMFYISADFENVMHLCPGKQVYVH